MSPLRLLVLLAALALTAPATALADPPGATTGEATAVTYQSATLNGIVNPNKEETTYYFEYGTTTAYGTKTPSGTEGGNAGKAVEAAISGLAPSTVYHFRLVATNPSGTDLGADKTFTTPASPYTLPPPPPPPPPNTITALATPPVIVFGSTSRISGQVAGPNAAGMQVQLQENPHPFTPPFKNLGAPIAADATGRYSFAVKPTKHTRYAAIAKASPPVSSAIVQVLVRTRVGFNVNDTRIRRGQRVLFKGTVAPAHNGRRVSIQRRTRTGRYRTIARSTLRATTGGRSAYSKRIRVFSRGTFRVRFSADADHALGTSRRRTIRLG